jgi:GH18 family chitinase
MKFNKMSNDSIKLVLDSYNWNGINEIAIIGGIFMAGKDGSILVKENRNQWPEVFEGKDYKGKPINEHKKRDRLCSAEAIQTVIKYFKAKNMEIWLSQTAAGWLTGGSLGAVLENNGLIDKYSKKLINYTKEIGCIGVDFDWEFPPNEIQAKGYRRLMKLVKESGLKVSVCAIRPTVGEKYVDQCMDPSINGHAGKFMKWEEIINNKIVDNINVMQYLGYDPVKEELTVDMKLKKMKEWEDHYPKEYTKNRAINMLCGIGYYGFVIPKFKKDKKKRPVAIGKIAEKYGEQSLDKKVIDGIAIWSTDDVSNIIVEAKKRGWTGVFTWLVTHDVNNSFDKKYSRQESLAQTINKIWNEE